MLHQPVLHPDGVVEGRGQAVEDEGPGPGAAGAAQGGRALRAAQLRGFSRPQDPGQEGLRRRPVLRAAVFREGGEASFVGSGGGGPGFPAGEADDGAVLQGGDGEGAPFPLPAQIPDRSQFLGQAAPEGLIGFRVQGQGLLHQGGDLGKANVLGFLRRGGGQGQRRQQGGGQGQGKQAFHGHPSKSCCVPLDGGGGKKVPAPAAIETSYFSWSRVREKLSMKVSRKYSTSGRP